MCTLQLTRSTKTREELREVLSEVASVATLGTIVVAAGTMKWERLICKRDRAVAVVAIGEALGSPACVLVSISPDARRLWRVWNILGDMRLVRLIRRRMLDAGARIVVED